MPGQEKSKWDKADVILKPLGGLFTALAVAALGFFGSKFLENRQLLESKTRLYAELMSKREQADSSLRKGMFDSIIATFLKPESAGFKEKVLALELLAYNFHDALDLGPLFKHVHGEISGLRAKANSEISSASKTGGTNGKKEASDELGAYLDRLEKVTLEVKNKQIAALEQAGWKLDQTIFFDELKPAGNQIINTDLPGDLSDTGPSKPTLRKRHFTVEVLSAHPERKELRIRLSALPLTPTGEPVVQGTEIVDSTFSLGFFDFPMIDNTRLSNGARCAIVLTAFDNESAEITLVYFPGSRASLKDKPFYDEVITDLLNK